MRRRLGPGVIAAAAALALVAGCGSDTDGSTPDTGAAEATASGENTDSGVTAAEGELDPGENRTWPRAEYAQVRDETQGYMIEAQRLAEYVALPSAIDSALGKNSTLGVLKGPEATDLILPQEAVPILTDAGMLSGFSTGGSSDTAPDSAADPVGRATSANVLNISVLRFPDEAAAADAARDVHEVLITEGAPDQYTGTPRPADTETAIDVLPETLASSNTQNDALSVNTLTARGDFVIYVNGYSGSGDEQWAARTIARAVDEQGTLLDQFPATPIGQFDSLPIDVDKVLILTLPAEERSVNQLSVYGARGLKHFTVSGDLDAVLDETGTDRVAIDDSMVYRSADAEGAEKLYQAMNDGDLEDGVYEQSAPAPGVPGSSCISKESTTETTIRCRVHVGRYTAMVDTKDDELAAHQRITAQYMILDAVA
ncbi:MULTISPECIES: DUF7373 family lipoprotein [Nocardiaceae]|uniref:DUF7373 family lipoprotein n=1 Tax=Nocardiaceae TaxID=85025 RepID=UPI0012D2F6D0|nr:hypothetical protein [Rhodococcus fascians]